MDGPLRRASVTLRDTPLWNGMEFDMLDDAFMRSLLYHYFIFVFK